MEWIHQPEAWVALLTLTSLELVLGIDNIVFISVLVSRLPPVQRAKARVIGLVLAMLTRILLLFILGWIMKLTQPLFSLLHRGFSIKDIILVMGGLFLIAKSTHEIHANLEAVNDKHLLPKEKYAGFVGILIQIVAIDIIFSIDSVITAVGLAKHIEVMVIAIVISVFIMIISANMIGRFIDRHPTIKMLALSFLILIGVALIAEGLDFYIPKGYIYFAMAFSFFVEMLNIRLLTNKYKPVELSKRL